MNKFSEANGVVKKIIVGGVIVDKKRLEEIKDKLAPTPKDPTKQDMMDIAGEYMREKWS